VSAVIKTGSTRVGHRPAEQEEDFQLITEMGVTCVRLAHYQQDQVVYDLCDHNGLVLWTD